MFRKEIHFLEEGLDVGCRQVVFRFENTPLVPHPSPDLPLTRTTTTTYPSHGPPPPPPLVPAVCFEQSVGIDGKPPFVTRLH